jgi:hypothetical protein
MKARPFINAHHKLFILFPPAVLMGFQAVSPGLFDFKPFR